MKTPIYSKEIWLKFAQLVQHANVANCTHAATEIKRGTYRFIASRRDRLEAEQLVQSRGDHLADVIMQLRNIDLGTPDEIRIKKQCLEILVEMKQLAELAPLGTLEAQPIIPKVKEVVAEVRPEPEITQESDLDREFRLLAS